MLTIGNTLQGFQNDLAERRSASTVRSYRNAIRAFQRTLEGHGIDIDETPAADISAAWVGLFRQGLDELSRSTRKIYLTAVLGWYRYLADELGLAVDLEQVRHMARPALRQGPGQDAPVEVDRLVRPLLLHVQALTDLPARHLREKLRRQRDRAFVILLADTGLSVRSLCGLRRSDVFWSERKIRGRTGSGLSMPARLSNEALAALRAYLDSRLGLDDATRKPAHTLPVFARHDRGAGDKVLPLSAASARQMLRQHARQALGELGDEASKPVTFHRYFVQRNLQSSLGLLHPNIVSKCRGFFEAGRYADALAAATAMVEHELMAAAGRSYSARGLELVRLTMESSPAPISMSADPGRQADLAAFFRGFFRLVEEHAAVWTNSDPVRVFELLVFSSLCLRILSESR